MMRSSEKLYIAGLMTIAACAACAVMLSAPSLAQTTPTATEKLDYNRDIRKILSDKCFKCHGPDPKTQKAGLRLDSFDAATVPAKSGETPIVPGKPDRSELVKRIFHADPEEVMPPASAKNPLTEEQRQLLKRWVAEGAEYKPHWSFVTPKKPALPRVKQEKWPRNGIDYFVLARLEREGRSPSREADRYTLVRRVYLDLIGLPPTIAEADAFVNDTAPDAYEKLVDRLLDSPAYGERWARPWLDLARYGDTNGYEKDRPRTMWAYRDWVIGALNRDMPFDQFTVEQIAGDMLPGATQDQIVATGFHRNTMTNEEGGIDPLEFRFYSQVDRVGTTGTIWLGLTVACSQCHTHKYDPLLQKEFYGMMAFFDQADEPKIPVIKPDIAARRAEIEKRVAAMEATLAERFPVPGDVEWSVPKVAQASSASGATLTASPDGSLLVAGAIPETDAYTVTLESHASEISAIRLEALTDATLGATGPGRTPHGNFVLTELIVTTAPKDGQGAQIKLARAEADFSQQGFDPTGVFDAKPNTGWAIQGEGKWNVNRTATFYFESPVALPAGTRLTVKLDQQYGGKHTLGKFRISVGKPLKDDRPVEARRKEHLDKKFAAWRDAMMPRAARWSVLKPTELKSNLPFLDALDDGSVLASGDQTKLDVYQLKYANTLPRITAIRLEALPDPSLPEGGPGRTWYEGTFGDFYLSGLTVTANGQPVKLAGAYQDFAEGANTAAGAIDASTDTGWSVAGAVGREHRAVFTLAQPLENAKSLDVKMVFERWFAAALGRFRISVTDDTLASPTAELTAKIEAILTTPAEERSAEQNANLLAHYLSVAPELAGERAKIQQLRQQMPQYPTTLVMKQRDGARYRPTQLHNRGEFLKPAGPIEPTVASVLHKLPEGPRDRLAFARWLVDEKNPLVGRVTMNRHWAAFFGRGIVRTTEDFGVQGESPTHPELLDYLATELVRSGWSIKRMHRLIVTSATYRQTSTASDELLITDPENKLMARGPRFRIEAELIRDVTLRAAGLLTRKVGGPSVFPPQPPGVTDENYGASVKWATATNGDRYRRGLYTFAKRTAPYAMFSLFGSPSGEQCIPRRERANTPLQALTMLNDTVFMEAAKALAETALRGPYDSDEQRVAAIFRAVLVRPPSPGELQSITVFYRDQLTRLKAENTLATQLGGNGADAPEKAAWIAVARVILNLDEAITKE